MSLKQESYYKNLDPLLQALVLYTKLYHKPISAEALTHALPSKDGGISAKLFSTNEAKALMSRAAHQAGLKTSLVKKELNSISSLHLPMILILKHQNSCILEEFSEDRKSVKIIYPEADNSYDWVDIEKLEQEYTGYAFLVKKEYSYLERDHNRLQWVSKHWFWDTIKISKKIYTDIIFASVLINFFVLATPLFTRNVYDRVIPNNAIETLWYFAGGVLVIYTLDIFLKFTRTYFLELAAKKSDVIMSSEIFSKVLDMKMSSYPKSIGSFASNLKDFDTIRSFLTSVSLTAFIDLPFAILFLFVIGYLGGPIVWVPVITILLIISYALIVRKPLYKKIEQMHQAAAHKNGVLIETLNNIETIKTLRANSQMQWRWEESTGEIADKGMKSRLLSASLPNVTSYLVQFNSVFIVVVGVYLIKDFQMSMGDLIAIVILTSRTISPFSQAAALIANYEDVRSVYKTMNDIVNQPIERPLGKSFVSRENIDGKIEFKNVTFSYPDTEVEVLKNVSFTINSGEKVALIGSIGSGKTTIEKLLLHLYEPDSGSILIDGIDIRQIDPADLRSKIGYVSQHVSLFRGTLKDNISFGSSYISDEKILKASKISGVDQFASRHPKGYAMEIGEGGRGLSGGQRQCVAIARALLHDADLLVMDEPTNAMDQGFENKLIASMKDNFSNKTLIIITQKMALLDIVDRVIVVNDGTIYLDGAKSEVLKKLGGSNE
jgi:ATP-binding cassette subfamily C protein LapB